MGAILELTSYAATPVGMLVIVIIGAAAYFAARWFLATELHRRVLPHHSRAGRGARLLPARRPAQ